MAPPSQGVCVYMYGWLLIREVKSKTLLTAPTPSASSTLGTAGSRAQVRGQIASQPGLLRQAHATRLAVRLKCIVIQTYLLSNTMRIALSSSNICCSLSSLDNRETLSATVVASAMGCRILNLLRSC